MKFSDSKREAAIFAFTADPITIEHERIISLYARIFDPIYIFVSNNLDKENKVMFSKEERQTMTGIAMRKFVSLGYNIIVKSSDKLTSAEAKDLGVSFLIRGVRGPSDFQYEMNLANINTRLNPNLNTVLLISHDPDISSTLVRDLIKRRDCRWMQFVSQEVNAYINSIKKNV